ncbi:MAG TPA: hypothetical protein VMT43_04215, partial [Acidimicrobiales bacterium]|nr:hypothetical protein [Acidimicrobiales bacterium]
MRRRLALAVLVSLLVGASPASATAAGAPPPPARSGSAFAAGPGLATTQQVTYTFGQQPLADVMTAAHAQAACGLTTNQLATMVLAPTFPETGASGSSAPSPMTLSRYDTASGLYAFGNPSTPYQDAFWNPGVGAWQFDSAGGWQLTTTQEISTDSAASQATATIVAGWCNDTADASNPVARRAAAWAPWHGCGTNGATCEAIYQTIYGPTTLDVASDPSVGRLGGAVVHSCVADGTPLVCTHVDPTVAQGDDAFAQPGFGPSPISAPFYDYVQSGNEHRVWLGVDSGYHANLGAALPLGSNARTSLTWTTAPGLCDRTLMVGTCDWSGWSAFPSVFNGRPSVVANNDGRLEVFALGFDGVVYHTWQTAKNGPWSGWAALRGLTTARAIVAARSPSGLVVAARSSDGTAWVDTQSGSTWSPWVHTGGTLTGGLTAATNRDGRVELFGLSTAGVVVHQWQKTPGGTWSSWVSMGGPIGLQSLTAVTNVDGRLEVFLVGGWSTVYHAWQSTPGGSFSSWAQIGGSVDGGVAVGVNLSGTL